MRDKQTQIKFQFDIVLYMEWVTRFLEQNKLEIYQDSTCDDNDKAKPWNMER